MTEIRPNIWQLQSRHDVPSLVDALRHPDHDVRKRASLALHALDATPAIPALRAALRQESNEQTRRSLETTLRALAQQTDIDILVRNADVEGLIEALTSRHTENTIAAAAALGALGDRRAVEPLVILFQNSLSSPNVRLAAAEALLQLQSAPAVVTLLGALRRDSWQVRRNAAAVLGQIQAVWAVEPLIEALRDSHPVVRRTAAAALRRIGTADAVHALRTQFTEGTLGKRKPSEPDLPVMPAETVSESNAAPATNNLHVETTVPESPISEPPVEADDTVPSSTTRALRAQRAWQQATERVTFGTSVETPLSHTAARQDAAQEKTPRILQSVRRLIEFLNR